MTDLYTCQVEPKYLKSNATSHKNPFSAIFELCDNAHDANANYLTIEFLYKNADSSIPLQTKTNTSPNGKKNLNRSNDNLEAQTAEFRAVPQSTQNRNAVPSTAPPPESTNARKLKNVTTKQPFLKFFKTQATQKHTILGISDDGDGMDFNTLKEMVSFGYSNKSATNLNSAIGRFGNGFKSSSMRIANNCLVVTKQEPLVEGLAKTFNLALLSYDMLKMEKINTVKVPLLTLESDFLGKVKHVDTESVNFEMIDKYLPFKRKIAANLDLTVDRDQDDYLKTQNKFTQRQTENMMEQINLMYNFCEAVIPGKSGTALLLWGGEMKYELYCENFNKRLESPSLKDQFKVPS